MILDPDLRTVGRRISRLLLLMLRASSTQTMSTPSRDRMLSTERSRPRKMRLDPVLLCVIVVSVIVNPSLRPRASIRFSISSFEDSLIEF